MSRLSREHRECQASHRFGQRRAAQVSALPSAKASAHRPARQSLAILFGLVCLLGASAAAQPGPTRPASVAKSGPQAAAKSVPPTAAKSGAQPGPARPASGGGAAPTPAIAAANDRFWSGAFAAAAAGYRAALTEHPFSADLWFNLGCAEAEAGRLGAAIHALEEALALAPEHGDAAHNLAVVRARAIEGALGVGGELRVALPGEDDLGTGLLTAVRPATLAWLFGACWAGWFALLALWRRARSATWRTAASFGAVLTGLGALAAGGLLLGRARLDAAAAPGVVLPELARVRVGPGAQYKAALAVVGGVKVQLQGRDGDFVQVRLPDGSDGWLPEAEVAPLYLAGEPSAEVRTAALRPPLAETPSPAR